MSKTKSTSTEKDGIKSTISDLKKTFKVLAKADEELKAQREKVGKEAIGKLKDLISLSPYIEAIRWNQYTPHFNDGDACEFSVNDLEIKFAEDISGLGDKAENTKSEDDEDDDEDEDEDDEEFHNFGEYGDNITEYLNKRTDVINFKEVAQLEKIVEACYEIHDNLGNMSDTLLAVFGDHMLITVTRNGIETESYEDHE